MGLAPAGAAFAASPVSTAVTPATSPVSCASSTAWLRLWGSLGESCYLGNGTVVVYLPGVNREQIIGRHTVCLRSLSSFVCATGPGTLLHVPPITVREITIATP
jgi:hypothetical protein